MAKLPTPTRCRRGLRRLCLRFCNALDNTYILRQVLEHRREPFPPPGVPCLEDVPTWSEYLDCKTPGQKKEEEEEEDQTKNPSPDSEQNHPSEDSTFGVVYDHFEFSVAAATRLLDVHRGQLVVRNPDRMSLLHGGSERSVASGHDGAQDLLAVCGPDLDESLSEEQLDTSDAPIPSQEPASPASPTSPLYQTLDVGDSRGDAPPRDSRDVQPDGHISFWPPETAQVAILIPHVKPRLVSVLPPSPPLPPSPSSPAPYRTSLSQNPRRRGVIFPFI
ncbi:hypothetical protein CGRA01v4_10615 [Colletotrichum graminicola]|uniref:Uncharacterized protein n=1 Tax=Colletotrichum graminicola (strain M1.001 / M2 / FGSC 10212) TaxID=645133 RepID=E3QKC4_COLGM|nr:uncharacterized protein GLRG_06456 [Colletotrichum graminicola M1.001]EFQ31312.1 hypothetical protein GLRG_06456 [Colletotrichum graminicola M1.001]WDK19328.1 hypothetical protein CGRA01v4_10615 [Colletotrichum graminicola]